MIYTVDAELAGSRLDVAVASLLGISRSQAGSRVDAGLVTSEGQPLARSARVREGQRLEIGDRPEVVRPDAPPLPPVRYRDEHLLVVAKPAGLVVHPGPGHPGGTLVDALQAAEVALAARGGDERPGIVHRLDRDTSGLLVVACSDEAHLGLVEALRQRTVHRRYLALVVGVPAASRGRVEAPIGRDPRDRKRFAVVDDGKPASTRYRVLATGQVPGTELALLGCELLTGRTHQIRVHLSALGHPIVGDPVYGARPRFADALGLDRPFLHAAALAFTHPVTGEAVAVEEPLPDALAGALDRAGIARSAAGALHEAP